MMWLFIGVILCDIFIFKLMGICGIGNRVFVEGEVLLVCGSILGLKKFVYWVYIWMLKDGKIM